MTEEEARAWIVDRFDVPRETLLADYVALLLAEAEHQNLISASTVDTLWSRHIVDSAQLLLLAGEKVGGTWVDIGTGAGLPGIVVAILEPRNHYVLVEPRGKRVAFLEQCVAQLGLADRVQVIGSKIERYSPPHRADIVSARAVAPLPNLFASAAPSTSRKTLWLLPKGRNAQSEVEAARRAWQGSFHVEQSVTDPESGIVVAREVRPR
ncbi:16S rRNA (guanine(527)-N(7))-methyltransferase RsmG [Sphingosinithalassobacter portus]|uniref:16S rRNA (guanine(527)-N(7))-methyltransferase RsmG n=1 Tax=Stakelama portus TaxID=2676234 RepID=UPI000D6E6827|nr:16S rRNA (guanine(527)-N(7))-methyltransferase RsmG [Sphingosinithalassobacter portus]